MLPLDPKYIPASDLDGNKVPIWYGKWATFHKYMQDKHDICKTCELPDKPVLAETGFRIGYGAHSFLTAQPSTVRYYAYDIDPCEFGLSAVREAFPNTDTQLLLGNSYFVQTTLEPIDFFHVDVAHCFNGCMHDLELALKSVRPGGYILVDDYKLRGKHSKVKKAVDVFMAREKDKFSSIQYFDTWRGDYLFRKA